MTKSLRSLLLNVAIFLALFLGVAWLFGGPALRPRESSRNLSPRQVGSADCTYLNEAENALRTSLGRMNQANEAGLGRDALEKAHEEAAVRALTWSNKAPSNADLESLQGKVVWLLTREAAIYQDFMAGGSDADEANEYLAALESATQSVRTWRTAFKCP
jgi:hypothetical protein